MWFRNVDGEKNDPVRAAQHAAVMAPDPERPRRDPLEGRDVALFVDGRRVSVLAKASTLDPGSGDVVVQFVTTERALDEEGDAVMLKAWGAYQSGDSVIVKQPGQPRSGIMLIKEVKPPTHEGGSAYFIGEALTTIYEMPSGKVLAHPGEQCTVDTEFISSKV